jgi:hypothetical protein
LQVLATRQDLVDGRELPGQADRGAQAPGVLDHIEAGNAGAACVRLEQGGEDPDRGRLAGAVGPEEAVHGALRYRQVDSRQRRDIAERLRDAFDLDDCHSLPPKSMV